jgi:beta-lactamase superfamily II metal-dependent hydrolase
VSYSGIEIDMMSLGDADSILVTQWTGTEYVRVLIDGGNKGSVGAVREFLRHRGVNYLHHVVCTHPHDDHAGGLVGLLCDTSLHVDRVWVHNPEAHVNMLLVEYALSQTHGLRRAQVIKESLETLAALRRVCVLRGIPTSEPFGGAQIGMLTAVGPSEAYYSELVAQFADSGAICASEALVSSLPNTGLLETLLESMGTSDSEALDTSPATEPENNSSAVLAMRYDKGLYLFTGDAGAQALLHAAQRYNLEGCRWMQIPHHGSRRNITEPLVGYFRPNVAFVSAAGNAKHPRRSVVSAFRRAGARVYSTHYPNGGHLRHHAGVVPARGGYITATPLWEGRS